MLPNLTIPSIKILGPLEIHVFGLLVSTSVVLGYYLAKKRAADVGLNPDICSAGMIRGGFAGFLVAHWVSALFYFPERIVIEPLYLLKFWDGISSFGGFLGGTLTTYWYFRRVKVSFVDYLEAILFGLAPAWIIGRLACTIAFDHPGVATDFILGMMDENGVVRHNLGLYEMLSTMVTTGVLYLMKDVRPFRGFHIALLMVLYAPARFLWDSLRIVDRAYFGLTPGHYFSALFFLAGIGWMVAGLFHYREQRKGPRL